MPATQVHTPGSSNPTMHFSACPRCIVCFPICFHASLCYGCLIICLPRLYFTRGRPRSHSSLILCVLGSMAQFLVGFSEGWWYEWFIWVGLLKGGGVSARTFMLGVLLKLQDGCLCCDAISYNCQHLHHWINDLFSDLSSLFSSYDQIFIMIRLFPFRAKCSIY